ncbi:hypothetical protein [Dokdonella sp.]|uniref:hypothetical protein n=1 Tax=Dokdonella sp. TaxID=2291710 RepID=UPI003C690403
MPGVGEYLALCPSGLTPRQVELLFPVQHDHHAHHGLHETSKDVPGPGHEHGDGYCAFTVHSGADTVQSFTLLLAWLPAALNAVSRATSAVLSSIRYYEARGPPAILSPS